MAKIEALLGVEEEDDDIGSLLGVEEEASQTGRFSAGRTVRQAAGGAASGFLGTAGDIADFLHLQSPEILPGHKTALEAEYELPNWLSGIISDDDLAPRYNRLPSRREVSRILELSEPQNYPERAARRGAESAGGAASLGVGGLGTLLAIAGGGVAGQAVEDLTGSQIAGLLVELLSPLGFLTASENVVPRLGGKSGELARTALKHGATDAEVAPLVTGKFKGGLVRKAGKQKGIQKAATRARAGVNKVWSGVKAEAEGLAPIEREQLKNLRLAADEVRKSIPPGALSTSDEASLAKHLTEFKSKLIYGSVTPRTLIEDWRRINKIVNWNKPQDARMALQSLKEPMRQALERASPELAKEFGNVLELSQNLFTLEGSVGKLNASTIWDAGEIGGLITAVGTMNLPAAAAIAGADISRRVLTEFLLSPRGQGLMKKGASAISKGSANQIARINSQIEKDLLKMEKDLEG